MPQTRGRRVITRLSPNEPTPTRQSSQCVHSTPCGGELPLCPLIGMSLPHAGCSGHLLSCLKRTVALLLAAQTEKDLPKGFGYLDHAFFGFIATARAGFLPERRISCPMDGAYLPQQVSRARRDGRLLGQVRDLLVVRKPEQARATDPAILFLQGICDYKPTPIE